MPEEDLRPDEGLCILKRASATCQPESEEGLLKGDPSGSARLAAADERNNRALADAVERHAAKDLE